MDSSTNVSLLGNLPPLAITLITLYLFFALAHKIVSFMIPFNVSSMRVDQDNISAEVKRQTKIQQEQLQIEKQRLQIEIEKLNLERAKLNLPLYVPVSVATEQPRTTSAENNKPAV